MKNCAPPPSLRNRKPGRVNTTPAAMDSPADPVVWIILFSRIVVLKNFLPNVMAITAIGMDAETVSPAFNARYTVAAPKMMPNMQPSKMDFSVNSFICTPGATKGLKLLSDIRLFMDYR